MANAGYISKVERDWDIPQGADTVNGFRYTTNTGVDGAWVGPNFKTDGWTARAQIRSSAGGAVWVTFLSSELTGPRVALEDDGHVTIVLPHDVTEDPSWNSRYVGYYDLEIVNPANDEVIRLARGTVNVTHDYTRTEA